MTYAEKLSILLNNQYLENILNNDGLRAVNSYGKEQARKAYQYRLDDIAVVSHLLNGRSGSKFKQLYTNGELVWDYYRKYHDGKYAIGALVMYLLRATDFNKQQTNRILHRSPTFKYWNNPRNSRPGKNLEVINWDNIPTRRDLFNCMTIGELCSDNLAKKIKQPMEA